jgi:hypothetical protein
MTQRTFQFRLHSKHGSHKTGESTPVVERLSDAGVWEVQEPGLTTPPFRLSLIALLLCLRFHLIQEAEKRQMPLKALRGTLTVDVTEDWDIERWSAHFAVVLDAAASGVAQTNADAPALAALRARMERSPVARNMPPAIHKQIDVVFAD